MIKSIKRAVLFGILVGSAHTGFAQSESAPYEGLKIYEDTKDQRMEWFREARFGMFIHWGLYAGAGGSWAGERYPQHYSEWIQAWAKVPSSEYGKVLKPTFTASKFDADEWARIAKEAGMKYVVITSRHHDGFTIFNSKTPYSLDNPVTGGTNISPAGRDLYGEVISAFKKQGLKAGAYYSLLDWQHPDSYEGFQFNKNESNYQPNRETYKEYLYQQVKELATNYETLDILWPDFSTAQKQGETWGTRRMLEDVIKWQPQIIVNNRFWDDLENKKGDIGTPEKYVPPTGLPGMDWEVNHTMNESFGFSFHDENWKSPRKIKELFVETVSKGGNFLLNVGPDAEGAFPAAVVNILSEVGAWMKVNNEAIYGTTASPFQALDWGYCTQKPGKLYLHVFDVPTSGKITVPLSNALSNVRILGDDVHALQISPSAEGQVISLPTNFAGELPLVVAVEVSGQLDVLQAKIEAKNTGEIALTADNAIADANRAIRLAGATHNNPNRPNAFTKWESTTDVVNWHIQVRKPGKYKVLINYLPSKDKSGEISVTMNDEVITTRLETREGGKDFIQKEVGFFNIEQAQLGVSEIPVLLKALVIDKTMLPEIAGLTIVPAE